MDTVTALLALLCASNAGLSIGHAVSKRPGMAAFNGASAVLMALIFLWELR